MDEKFENYPHLNFSPFTVLTLYQFHIACNLLIAVNEVDDTMSDEDEAKTSYPAPKKMEFTDIQRRLQKFCDDASSSSVDSAKVCIDGWRL